MVSENRKKAEAKRRYTVRTKRRSDSSVLSEGVVKKFFSQRGFGFITDRTYGYDVFFNLSSVSNFNPDIPLEGVIVTYNTAYSPKGRKALNITAQYDGIGMFKPSSKKPKEYLLSDDPFVVKRGRRLPAGIEVLETYPYEINVFVRDPAACADKFKKHLIKTGANAVINVREEHKTRSERSCSGRGWHYFTIHRYIGTVARVGRAVTSGVKKSELDDLTEKMKSVRRSNMMKFAFITALKSAIPVVLLNAVFNVFNVPYQLYKIGIEEYLSSDQVFFGICAMAAALAAFCSTDWIWLRKKS